VTPKLDIIIPNFNGCEHLKTCFDSMKKQTCSEYRVILVDNGSKDDSVKYTREAMPSALIIELNSNSGFARAVNEGIRKSMATPESEVILLLNNDMELAADFLEKGLNVFKEHTDVSSVAVKMMNYFKREIIDDCGDMIRAHGGSPIARGNRETDKGQFDKPEYIFGACAGAAFYTKELFTQIGLFDESFFAYYEDVDFSFRAQLAGYKCYYEPRAVCYHKRGGTSTIFPSGFQTELCERNLVLMRFRNYPLAIYILYQPLFFIARLRRYYNYYRQISGTLVLKATKGYIKGIFLIWTKIPDRLKIQKSKIVSNKYIKGLFVKSDIFE